MYLYTEKIVSRVRVVALSLCYTDTHCVTHALYSRQAHIRRFARESRSQIGGKKINNEKRVGRARAFQNRAGKKNFDRRYVAVFLTRRTRYILS